MDPGGPGVVRAVALGKRGAPPARGIMAWNKLTADAACRLVLEDKGLLWSGDFQNERKLLQAMARRVDRPPKGDPPRTESASRIEAFAVQQGLRKWPTSLWIPELRRG